MGSALEFLKFVLLNERSRLLVVGLELNDLKGSCSSSVWDILYPETGT